VESVKKKIVCTVTNDLNYDQRMIRICTSLANAGYDVELVGRLRKHSLPVTERNYKQTRLRCFFNKGKFFYLEYNIRLFFFLVFRNADVFSAVDLDTLLANTLASRIRSKKLIFDAHEYFTETPEVTNRQFTKTIWSWVAQLCIRHTDLAYTVNQSLADIFTDLYKTKFEVIRSVPIKSAFEPSGDIKTDSVILSAPIAIGGERPVILYQGALNEGRGIEQCILAMKQLDAVFWIVGEGDLSDRLRNMVVENDLSDKVKFFGFILPGELKQITLQATIGYNTFENKGLSYYYSLNNKFFDYIHAALPQVCAPYAEFGKINAEYNIAVTAECTVEEIIVAVNTLLNDANLYARIKANCIKAAEVFNWQHEELELIRIYKQIH
jgi:glycosyltransferase involved in cell wall biosynthesis